MIAPAQRSDFASHPAFTPADAARRLRAEIYGDCLGLAYRGAFYALAATPIWGTALMVTVIWHHTHLS